MRRKSLIISLLRCMYHSTKASSNWYGYAIFTIFSLSLIDIEIHLYVYATEISYFGCCVDGRTSNTRNIEKSTLILISLALFWIIPCKIYFAFQTQNNPTTVLGYFLLQITQLNQNQRVLGKIVIWFIHW